MSTALYRRYRPETFDEVIGQEHVTDPLKAAIERGRINHAYLFSGPRGCGKTTSARILARCLNCEKGPTPVPCGECPSCRDLANGGPGSLDVVEIDAASHNGVDDARDLRERAIYAPARDRYKVFILDEAHMVTSQGFNALLKIVEEPPPHIKFIFATTEPEKVIGTIRSRTHHYPFRLVPPETLGNYLDELCHRENVQVAKGVLPLVVRAGGGSVRDTLSVLDQLIAGSGPDGVDYGTAVALLGYTPDSLLSDIVDAFSAGDGAGVYRAVERVVESGQDPRRFVEDLLERMRDLIVIHAAPEAAHAFLPGTPPDLLERLTLQAQGFGQAELSRAADLLNDGLTEMSGATSPRLQLELICARVLLPSAGRTRDAMLSRVERVERRIGMTPTGTATNLPQNPPATAAANVAANLGDGAAPQAPAHDGPTSPNASSGAPGAGAPASGGPVSGAPTSGGPVSGAPSADDDFADLAAMAAEAESMLRSSPVPEPRSEQVSVPEARTEERPTPSAGTDQRPAPETQREDRPAPAARTEQTAPVEPAPSQSDQRRPVQSQPAPNQPAPSDQSGRWPSQDQRDQRGPQNQQPQNQQPESAQRPDPARSSARPSAPQGPVGSAAQPASHPAGPGDAPGAGGEIEAIRRAWPSILAALEKHSKLTRALVAANAIPQSFENGVLYLGFNNEGAVRGFQQRDHASKLALAINDVLGIRARIDVGDIGRITGGGATGGFAGNGPDGGNSDGHSGENNGGRGGFGDGGGFGGGAPAGSGPYRGGPNGGGANSGGAPSGRAGQGDSPRRPSAEEVAAVVGRREVDKPQVDHEKFWETDASPSGPWSDGGSANSDARPAPGGGLPAPDGTRPVPDDGGARNRNEFRAPAPEVQENFGRMAQPSSAETAAPPAAWPTPETDSAERAYFENAPVEPTHVHDVPVEPTPSAEPTPTAEPAPVVESMPDFVVPDLSDADFGLPPLAEDHPTGPAPVKEHLAHRAPTKHSRAQAADEPMEYVQPQWNEPAWHDAPDDSSGVPFGGDSTGPFGDDATGGPSSTNAGDVPNGGDEVRDASDSFGGSAPAQSDDAAAGSFGTDFSSESSDDATSAGAGAVSVGALVVPPPEDDDDEGYGDYSDPSASAPTASAAYGIAAPGDGAPGSSAPTSRFAAIAQRHGGSVPNASAARPPARPNPSGPGVNRGHGAANSGPMEDEYDPETDLDVSEAPQIGVAVVERVLGGQVIDEREV